MGDAEWARQWEACLTALDRQGVRWVRMNRADLERLTAFWDAHARMLPDWCDGWGLWFRGVKLLVRRG